MKYTQKEWLSELKRRFGENPSNWKFVCPACGRITSGKEIEDAVGEPNDMYQQCIGRLNGKGISGSELKPGDPPPKNGCDWAAFGLFGTLGKGDVVITPDGKEVAAFAMAPADKDTE